MSGGKSTAVCRYFASGGTCFYGNECQFIHGTPHAKHAGTSLGHHTPHHHHQQQHVPPALSGSVVAAPTAVTTSTPSSSAGSLAGSSGGPPGVSSVASHPNLQHLSTPPPHLQSQPPSSNDDIGVLSDDILFSGYDLPAESKLSSYIATRLLPVAGTSSKDVNLAASLSNLSLRVQADHSSISSDLLGVTTGAVRPGSVAARTSASVAAGSPTSSPSSGLNSVSASPISSSSSAAAAAVGSPHAATACGVRPTAYVIGPKATGLAADGGVHSLACSPQPASHHPPQPALHHHPHHHHHSPVVQHVHQQNSLQHHHHTQQQSHGLLRADRDSPDDLSLVAQRRSSLSSCASPFMRSGASASPLTVSTPNGVPAPLMDTAPTVAAFAATGGNLYQESLGGTTYFYQSPGGDDAVVSGDVTSLADLAAAAAAAATAADALVPPACHVYVGPPPHVEHMRPKPSAPSFFMADDLRLDILNRAAIVNSHANVDLFPDLPQQVDNYTNICPLETKANKSQCYGYVTSVYKATNVKSGLVYCLRRIHGFRLSSTKPIIEIVDHWKKIQHSNVVQLRELFTTKAFGDNSLVFVYDFFAGAQTMKQVYFNSPSVAPVTGGCFNGCASINGTSSIVSQQQSTTGKVQQPRNVSSRSLQQSRQAATTLR